MKNITNKFILSCALVMMTSLLYMCSSSKPNTAEADIVNSKGKTVGILTLKQMDNGVKITGTLENFPRGTHAIHIHEKGLTAPTDLKSAGGHFNPYGKEHGMNNPKGKHAGDLPNFEVGKDGKTKIDILAEEVTLKKGEKNSLLREGGTSIIIHKGEDDYKSNPAGDAGPRIAGGSISERMN